MKKLIRWSIYLLIILIITIVLRMYVVQRMTVDGGSMEHTLSDGDGILIDKLSYRLHKPKRFDVVVFSYKSTGDVLYIKRIIGLPGETVEIREGVILIDGVVLNESYGAESIVNPGIAASPVHLSEGQYFVLGDNRNFSDDSRLERIGPLLDKQIIGKAWLRITPFSKFGFIS